MQIKNKIIFLILVLPFTLFGQGKSQLALGFDANYYYCFMGNDIHNGFNYGFSILISYNIHNIKVSTGINYSTKSYYYKVNPELSNDYLLKREYNTPYINFPFFIYFGYKRDKKLIINPFTGIIFNKNLTFDIKSYYSDNSVKKQEFESSDNLGIAQRAGIYFIKKISDKISIDITSFCDIKWIINKGTQFSDNDYRSFPDNRFSLGFNIAFEYNF